MSGSDDRDADAGDGRRDDRPDSGRAMDEGAAAPRRGAGGRRAAAERSRIARSILDLLVGEIMRRLKRRFPDPPTIVGTGGRRRQRGEVVSSALSPRRLAGGLLPRRRARVARAPTRPGPCRSDGA